MTEQEEELRIQMLDSLINLMDKARCEKDMPMLEAYARLVCECWNAIVNKENETC
jgi:hypothetical protein